MVTNFNLDLSAYNKYIPKIIHMMQFETGRQLTMTIDADAISSAELWILRPNNTHYMAECLVNGRTIVCAIPDEFLAVTGNAMCQLKLFKSGEWVNTFSFVLAVEKSAEGEITEAETTILTEWFANEGQALLDAWTEESKAKIEQKGQETIDSIPDDYTALTNRVIANENHLSRVDNDQRTQDRRLSNHDYEINALLKMQSGQTHDFRTVEDEGYTVDVPNGALMANVKKIGGHSEVVDGSIISAEVDRVTARGRNLWDEETALGYYGSNGAFNSATNQLCTKNKIKVEPNTTYHLSAPSNVIPYYALCSYDSAGTFINRVNPNNANFTTDSTTEYVCINFSTPYGTTYGNNIALIKGTSGSYAKNFKESASLPSALKQLPLYGASAGTAYNYVDFEPKRYSNMKSVDLGTLNWTLNNRVSSPYMFRAELADYRRPINNTEIPIWALSNEYVAESTSAIANSSFSLNHSFGFEYASGYSRLYIADKAFENKTPAEVKELLKGKILWYESTDGGSDYDAYLYHQRVGSVDLESISWSAVVFNPNGWSTTSIQGIKYVPNNTVLANAISNNYELRIASGGSTAMVGYFAVDTTQVVVFSGLNNDSANKPKGMLYYELATERIYDITDLVKGGIILPSESGGTLTFENDSRLEVPNTVEYLVNLAEVI